MNSKASSGISQREVLRLAIPIIISNLTIPLLGLVDTAVMGHLPGPEYLGAVGLGATIFSFLFWGFGFLRMGTTGVVAQAWGRNDSQALKGLLLQALALAVILALLLLSFQKLLTYAAMQLVDARPHVEALTEEYLTVRIWSAPATLCNYVMLGWFLGMQNTRASLVHMTVVNGVNIILDLVFVQVLGMTVAGVALASVVAEYCGLIVGLFLVFKLLGKDRDRPWPWHWLKDMAGIKRLVKLNTDIMIRTLCLVFAFAFFTRQSATFGATLLAVNTVLLNFQSLMAYGLDGFAHAAEALVGRALGENRQSLLKDATRKTFNASLLTAAGVTLVYWLVGDSIVDMLTDIEEVRTLSRDYLFWIVLSPLVSFWSFWLDGVLIGATRSRQMRNTMMFALFGFFLPAWWLSQPLGNHGLWLSLMVLMIGRALSMWFSLSRHPLIMDSAT